MEIIKGGKMEEKKEVVEKEVVVGELPTQQVNRVKGEDGVEYNLITTQEALQRILEIAKDLKRELLGK